MVVDSNEPSDRVVGDAERRGSFGHREPFAGLLGRAIGVNVVSLPARHGQNDREIVIARRLSFGTLAENMGTSVAVIQSHYGHLRPEMAANELTQMSLADRDRIRRAPEGQEG